MVSDILRTILLVLIPLAIILFSFIFEKKNAPPWVIRKYIHTVGLTVAAIYGGFLISIDDILLTIGILAIILFTFSIPQSIRLIPRLLTMGTRKGESRFESFINTSITVTTTVLVLIYFDDQRWIYMASILSVAFGDGLGEFIGKPFGKHKYKIFANKSIEGSLGVFAGTFIGLLLTYVSFSLFSIDLFPIFFIISMVAMIIEGFSYSFIDNMVLPIATAILLVNLL